MKIACVGWGSLIWCPGELRIDGPWNPEGPELPLEFARHSVGDRLTLVLDASFGRVRTLWARLVTDDLEAAATNLADREHLDYSKHPEWIGGWPEVEPKNPIATIIGEWARTKGLDAVVWTALPPKFHSRLGTIPTEDEAVDFVRRQGPGSRAAEYVRRAPKQVSTPYRQSMERELEWLRRTT